ncbi:MAG: tetratricopeptide repeat protein [Caulobacteraceae bacterium]
MPARRRLLALPPLALRSMAIPSLAALAVAACATAPAGPSPAARIAANAAAPQGSGDTSPYGLFLAGQAAVNGGHGATAAAYFGRAASLDPGAGAHLLDARAFSASLLAGDVKRASAIAPVDPAAEPAIRHLGALTRGVEALAEGDARGAHAILTGPDVGAPHQGAAALLAPWAAAAAGDVAGATVHPVIAGEPIAQFFASLDQGKLYERFRRYDEAETAFRSLIARGDPGGLASLNLGELLERRGRAGEAVAIYDQAIARNPGDAALIEARDRAQAHKAPPPLPTIRQAAAEALIAPATVLMVQKQEETALAYLRLALRLDPGRDEAWMLVGDIMTDIGDLDAARAAYLTPKRGSDEFVAARGKLAWSYQGAGNKEAALKIARDAVAAAPGSQDAGSTLADLLRADERYDDSAQVLDRLIAERGETADWRLLYMRAVDFQESGRWADAERDLSAALKQRPDEPELLNFLGYSWIDRGENLPAAMVMVKKAVDLEPQSGAMLDSLGWGYYRLGDYKTAVEKLEAAVAIEAGDPDVNNHLGDAYWRVGRLTEARFQWSRVLTLEPTAKLRAEVEAKLKSGLDGAARPARVAGS